MATLASCVSPPRMMLSILRPLHRVIGRDAGLGDRRPERDLSRPAFGHDLGEIDARKLLAVIKRDQQHAENNSCEHRDPIPDPQTGCFNLVPNHFLALQMANAVTAATATAIAMIQPTERPD